MCAYQGFNTFHGFDTGPPPPRFPPVQVGGAQYPNFIVSSSVYPPHPGLAPPPMHPLVAATYGSCPVGTVAQPITDHGFPGIHFRNSTGGVGLLPGHNYLFPAEHCTIHAIKTGATPPWQMTSQQGNLPPHIKIEVPVNTTVAELLFGLGARNSDSKKNVVNEVVEKGNGQWAKGITIRGDEKDKVKKKICGYGWDKTRTGRPRERPLVWLYVTKD